MNINLRKVFVALLLLFSSVVGFAQTRPNAIGALKVDTTLCIPAEFESTLDYMLHTWAVQRAIKPDCVEVLVPENISDSVYISRLKRLPGIMEMPYNSNVKAFIELYTVRRRSQLSYMMGLSDYYFPLFEQVLAANKLPLELKYLPIIESALNTTAVSRMGAAGLWQFMVATGRMYG